MAYVDLNPIRANMAVTPEESDHTSIKERIAPHFNLGEAVHQQIEQQSLRRFEHPLKPLLHFEGGITEQQQRGILYNIRDYIELVDYTGRILCPNKRGAIPSQLAPILQRLNLSQKQWLENATTFEQLYYKKFSVRTYLADTG